MLAKIGYAVKHASHKNDLDDVQGRRSSDSGLLTYLTRQPQLDISGVKTTEEFVKTPNEEGTMFTRLYEPEDATKVKGMVFHCVGFCDTIDWTPTDIGVHFAKQGFVVFMFDNKGMGRSDGLFSYINNWEEDMVEPALWLFDYAINKYIKPDPMYSKLIDEPQNYAVTGHRMGGANAICIALRLQERKREKTEDSWNIKCVVLMAPLVTIAENQLPPACVKWTLTSILAPVWSHAKLAAIDLDIQSREDELTQLIDDNPIAYPHKHVSLRSAVASLHVVDFIEKNTKEFKTPLLLCQGDDDLLTDPAGAIRFCKECGCDENDKEIKIYQGKGHVLWKEVPTMLDDAIDWINSKMHRLLII
eukprot:304645_1